MRKNLLIVLSMLAATSLAGCCKSNSDSASGNNGTGPGPASTAAVQSFAGTYSSNWGNTVFTQSGTLVNAVYARGRMTCTAAADTLDCTWIEGASSGKARLFQMTNGDIKGTWGNGTSYTDGGPWLFKRI